MIFKFHSRPICAKGETADTVEQVKVVHHVTAAVRIPAATQ